MMLLDHWLYIHVVFSVVSTTMIVFDGYTVADYAAAADVDADSYWLSKGHHKPAYRSVDYYYCLQTE